MARPERRACAPGVADTSGYGWAIARDTRPVWGADGTRRSLAKADRSHMGGSSFLELLPFFFGFCRDTSRKTTSSFLGGESLKRETHI